MSLSDTEWEDPPNYGKVAGELVDQALLVAAAKRRLTARLNKAADAQIAAVLDGAIDVSAPGVPGMTAAVAAALRELEADQLEEEALASAAGAELSAAADQAAAVLREPARVRRAVPDRGLPARGRRARHLVPAVVEAPRSRRPTRRAVALLGSTAPRTRHRDERVVARPRRPPHDPLLDPNGPFKGCTTEGHQINGELSPLPWDNPPEGLYDGPRS
nr:hypothetical protein [Kribbella flavida]